MALPSFAKASYESRVDPQGSIVADLFKRNDAMLMEVDTIKLEKDAMMEEIVEAERQVQRLSERLTAL